MPLDPHWARQLKQVLGALTLVILWFSYIAASPVRVYVKGQGGPWEDLHRNGEEMLLSLGLARERLGAKMDKDGL